MRTNKKKKRIEKEKRTIEFRIYDSYLHNNNRIALCILIKFMMLIGQPYVGDLVTILHAHTYLYRYYYALCVHNTLALRHFKSKEKRFHEYQHRHRTIICRKFHEYQMYFEMCVNDLSVCFFFVKYDMPFFSPQKRRCVYLFSTVRLLWMS